LKALVIGASGQVGGALAARLAERGHQVVGTHHGVLQPGTRSLDVTDCAATTRLIDETEPDWVLCPAGLTHVDYCESHAEEAMRVNRDAPAAAARAAAKHGAGFVYFSTEYVFDGTAGPYAENDLVNPQSVYASSKLEGERRATEENPRTIVIRTTVVYGPERQGKNFVYQVLKRARAREPIRVPSDQRSSPTYNPDLAAATVELIEQDFRGVLHVAGPVVLDRLAFALEVCAAFGLDAGLVAGVTTESLRQPARRPLNAGLAVDRARALLRTPLRGPREALTDMRRLLEAAGSVDTPRKRP
jgi:dTDP-4-dehydrorhamnose reductase